MTLLREIYEQEVDPSSKHVDESRFKKREAARAVVYDEEGRVALLYVGRHGYHKLPGGGIDEGEDISTALARELKEEIGCRAKVSQEVGTIIEHRNRFEMVQTSYCFVANVVGEKGEPAFTDEEKAEDFEIVWAVDIKQAISLLRQDETLDYEGKFITIRDLTFLEAVVGSS